MPGLSCCFCRWKVQCVLQGRSRTCIVDPTKSHDSNNLLLFVHPAVPDSHGMLVKCHCTADSCRRKQHTDLGRFVFVDDAWAFEPRKSAHDPMDTTAEATTAEVAVAAKAAEEAVGEEYQQPPLIVSSEKDANTYECVKKAFERTCFRIESPYLFAKLPKVPKLGQIPDLLRYDQIKTYYADVRYWDTQEDEDGAAKWVSKRFINRWLDDPKKREVTRVVVDPTRTSRGAYNLWAGYLAEQLPPVPDDEVEGLVQPIIVHIREVMANDNEAHTAYLLDWTANIIQRPWAKTNVAIKLFGKEGVGKGILFDWLRQGVLGKHCTSQTGDPENDIFGRFATGLVNKVSTAFPKPTRNRPSAAPICAF